MIIFSKIDSKQMFNFFFHLVFLSRIFSIHMAAGEGGGYFFHSFLSLLPAPQTDINRAINAENSPLHTASSRARPGIFAFWAQLAKHKATFWFIGNWMHDMNSQL